MTGEPKQRRKAQKASAGKRRKKDKMDKERAVASKERASAHQSGGTLERHADQKTEGMQNGGKEDYLSDVVSAWDRNESERDRMQIYSGRSLKEPRDERPRRR